jgi:hypothetical protein
MSASDRHSKDTAPLAREELDRLAAKSTVIYPRARGGARQDRDRRAIEQRPTSKLHEDELIVLAVRSIRAPTNDQIAHPRSERAGTDHGEHERRTRQIDPKRFQQLLRAQRAAIEIAPDQLAGLEPAQLRATGTGHELARIELGAQAPEPPPPVARANTSFWIEQRRGSRRIVSASVAIGLLVALGLVLLLALV